MTTWIEPLNLKYWFVNVLAGSPEIFIFVSFLAIAIMAAYFRMMNYVSLLFFILWSIILGYFIPSVSPIYLTVMLLVGLFGTYIISKIWKT